MIQYIFHKDLDFKKYNACIQNAYNSRIYAFSWYLDIVVDDWDVLVLNDYKAVMPLPKRKKYGLPYIYQPPWVQQLGVFSAKEIKSSLVKSFIDSIPKKYVLVDYLFNSENKVTNQYIKTKINFLVKLDKGVEELSKHFNKNRKRIINTGFDEIFIDKQGDKNTFLNFYKLHKLKYKTHKDSFLKLEELIKCDNDNTYVWNVFKNDEMISGLFWLKDDSRITYLVPVSNKIGKFKNAASLIIYELIKQFQNTKYVLDLEGSMVEGVARFYKSFGAEEELYYWYKKHLI